MFLKELLYFNKSDRKVFLTFLTIALIAMAVFFIAGRCNSESNEVEETEYIDEMEDEEEATEEEETTEETTAAEESTAEKSHGSRGKRQRSIDRGTSSRKHKRINVLKDVL